MVNLTCVQIINHVHGLLNSLHAARECRSSCSASQAQHCCLSPWLIHPLFFPFPHCELYVLQVCIGPYMLEVNYWIPLRCTPASSAWLSALNRRSLGLLELNHNYLPSSDGGESVHCVIPISPLDMKNASRIQRGNIMSVSWIWLARQNLRLGYGRPWVALSALSLPSPSFHPSLSSFLLCYFFPYISLSFLLVFVSLHPSCLSFSLRLSLLCCPFSTTAATVLVPAKNVCLGLKFHSYKRDIVAVPQGDWQRDWVAAFLL